MTSSYKSAATNFMGFYYMKRKKAVREDTLPNFYYGVNFGEDILPIFIRAWILGRILPILLGREFWERMS